MRSGDSLGAGTSVSMSAPGLNRPLQSRRMARIAARISPAYPVSRPVPGAGRLPRRRGTPRIYRIFMAEPFTGLWAHAKKMPEALKISRRGSRGILGGGFSFPKRQSATRGSRRRAGRSHGFHRRTRGLLFSGRRSRALPFVPRKGASA